MSKEDFRITIASLSDRENDVAEINYRHEQWAEVSAETPHEYVVQFYNKRDVNYWEFSYDEAMEVLAEAKERLYKYQRTPEEQAEYDADQKAMEKWQPTSEETAEYERKMKEQWEKYYG